MVKSFGVILPHTRMFGGVKRFFEIGNLLIKNGHRFTVFTPDGQAPHWFEFAGDVRRLADLSAYNIDVLFITEPEYLTHLRNSDARLKVFYAVLERAYIRRVARQEDLLVLANSSSLYRYLGGGRRSNIIKAIGGIDLTKFRYHESERHTPFTVLVYGRFYRKKKGVNLVVRACEQLYKRGFNLRLLLFDTPVDEVSRKKVEQFTCKVPFHFFVDYPTNQIAELYQMADVFVSAERNAGWANTAAEAMASGVPVIATRSGTRDFVIHEETGLVVLRHPWFIRRAIARLYNDEHMRLKLRADGRRKIEMYSWSSLSNTIEQIAHERLP